MLDSPITWVSAIRLGLFWGGEYALLSLIEDAPEALKVATVLCSIGALASLEGRSWLNKRRANLFVIIIASISTIYGSFVIYAFAHAYHQSVISSNLDRLYNTGTEIVERPFFKRLTSDKAPEWQKDGEGWVEETKAFLDAEIGGIASARFVNTVGSTAESYNIPSEFERGVNALVPMLKNLAEIIRERK